MHANIHLIVYRWIPVTPRPLARMAFMRSALLVLGTAIAVVWLPSLLKPKLPVNVGGFALPKWKKVEAVFM